MLNRALSSSISNDRSCIQMLLVVSPLQMHDTSTMSAILSSMPLLAKSGTRPATPSCKQPAVWADLDNDAAHTRHER
jgi:hypothetical protein